MNFKVNFSNGASIKLMKLPEGLTFSGLKKEIFEKTTIPMEEQHIMGGFPPKPIQGEDVRVFEYYRVSYAITDNRRNISMIGCIARVIGNSFGIGTCLKRATTITRRWRTRTTNFGFSEKSHSC